MFNNVFKFLNIAFCAPFTLMKQNAFAHGYAQKSLRYFLWRISALCLYFRLFFLPSLLNLPFWNNASTDRDLCKIIKIRWKDNLCIWRTSTSRVSRRTTYNFWGIEMYCINAAIIFILIIWDVFYIRLNSENHKKLSWSNGSKPMNPKW